MDTGLFRIINDRFKNPFFDWFLPLFSDKDYLIIPALLIMGYWAYVGGKRTRFITLCLLISIAITDIGSEKVIKNIVRSPRPYAVLEGVHLHRGDGWRDYDPAYYPFDPRKSYSFPSSHAANIAAATAVLAFLSLHSLWVMVPLTLLVGISRVYTGNHFPLDILGAYLWGGIVGGGVTAVALEFRRRFWALNDENCHSGTPVERKWFYPLLGVWIIGNFLFLHLNLFDLAGDEAQYWDWSRRPALGYYSKPPLIAYVIRAMTSAGGHKEWAIRSGALLFSAATLVCLHALTLRISRSERAAWTAAMSAAALPATWAGSVIMTIDPVLVFFWTLAAYGFWRATKDDKFRFWVLTGLAVGLGLLAKYTAALILVAFLLYLIVYDRKWLTRKEPWLALALTLLCLSGVIYWNWAHDWVSFRHTAQIGASEEYTLWTPIRNLLELAGGQVGIVSPLIMGLFAWAGILCLMRAIDDHRAGYLVLLAGVPLVFYFVVSVARRPEANWPITGYIGASVALGWAWQFRDRGRWAKRFLVAAWVLGCLMGCAVRSTDLLYVMGAPPPGASPEKLYLGPWVINPDVDPTNRLRGGRELGQALSRYREDQTSETFLFSDRYQVTAWMAFYTAGRPRTYCLPFNRRQNQYDIWGGWADLSGRDGLFVTGGEGEKARRWVDMMLHAGLFEKGEVLETIEVRRHHTVVKQFTICRLHNYCGKELTPADVY